MTIMTEQITSNITAVVITTLAEELGITQEQGVAIKTSFESKIEGDPGASVHNLIAKCGDNYDTESLMIGAMLSAVIIDMVNKVDVAKRAEEAAKQAEIDRLSNAGMEFA